MEKVERLTRKALGTDLESHQNTSTNREQVAEPYAPYSEDEPTVAGWLRSHVPTRHDVLPYMASFFPFTSWIGRYNTRWLLADVIAGVTLGLVVIPQAMAYALLADLSPEYGLYTSFTGAALYWLFGTSKDVAIGATAVVSLLVGQTIDDVLKKQQTPLAEQNDAYYDAREQVAKTHAFLAGCVLLVCGLLRLDWLIEFIPHVSIAAFVTGASITISLSQTPALLGMQAEVDSKNAAYQVFIDTCRALPHTSLDAAIGISGLVLLALINWYCDRMAKRDPKRARMWNMISSLRLSVTVLLFTLVSFLVNRNVPFEESRFRILGQLPRGFIHTGPPSFDPKLISALLPQLPPTVIILVIEHIAIGKSFGRLNDYTVVPSQELMSIAFTNLTGPFVGAYASTGSFGGTAIQSKAGVRTPLAGVFNGVVLVLSLYVLTSALYYIPLASLAALIIHAVYNLITPPAELVRMWRAAPPDVLFYFVGVLVSVFASLEDGIYVTVALSLALLLLRIAKAGGQVLGHVTVYPYDYPLRHQNERGGAAGGGGGEGGEGKGQGEDNDLAEAESKTSIPTELQRPTSPSKTILSEVKSVQLSQYDEVDMLRLNPERDIFFRLDRREAVNPEIAIVTPHPGVFVFRFPNGLNYLNQAQLVDTLAKHIMSHTRRTTITEYAHPGDRPWNEPAPPTAKQKRNNPDSTPRDTSSTPSRSSSVTASAATIPPQLLPTLRAVALDCATIHHTDSGAVEGLADLRAQLDRWAAPNAVEWHFAHLRGWWTRRAFAAAGFGRCQLGGGSASRPGFSLAARYESEASGGGDTMKLAVRSSTSQDEEMGGGSETEVTGDGKETVNKQPQPSEAVPVPCSPRDLGRLVPVTGVDRPYFHVDLAAAVEAATRHAVLATAAAL